MKVSRKVGLRKRASSYSISRRRLRSKKSYKKNSYRKKNAKTQKGGKRGRGYKRMRARTHKRGKRFHRGGMLDECYVELGKLSDKQLRYKKEGPLSTAETKPFDATIYGWKFITDVENTTGDDSTTGEKINVGCFYGKDTAKIVFTRKTEKPVTITIEFTLGRFEVTKSDILSSGTAKEGEKVVKYSFDYPENTKFYEEALKIIDENRKKNKKLTESEKKAKETKEKKKEDEKKQKVENGRLQYSNVKKEVEDMETNDDYRNLRVKLYRYTAGVGMEQPEPEISFEEFKSEQEKLAEEVKQSIQYDNSLSEQDKTNNTSKVDELLKKIIDSQRKLMLDTYFFSKASEGDGYNYMLQYDVSPREKYVEKDGEIEYQKIKSLIDDMKKLTQTTPEPETPPTLVPTSDT
jgi:hypothetical protein